MFLTTHIPYQICGAQQDNSTACMSSQAGSASDRTPITTTSAAARAATSRPIRSIENVYYAGSYGGLLTRYDRRTGQQRNINIWPDNPMGYGVRRHHGALPVDVPDHLLAGRQEDDLRLVAEHLEDDRTRGRRWTKISPDLRATIRRRWARRAARSPRTTPASRPTAVIFTIAPAPQDINTIWTGSDDGLVHVTRNGGQNWDNVTPKDLPEFARISLIEASPHTNGTAYVAANRYQLDDQKPYVYKTDGLRQDLDEDRHRHEGHPLRAADSRGSRSARACCISAPRTASTSRSTTARTGSRCS